MISKWRLVTSGVSKELTGIELCGWHQKCMVWLTGLREGMQDRTQVGGHGAMVLNWKGGFKS